MQRLLLLASMASLLLGCATNHSQSVAKNYLYKTPNGEMTWMAYDRPQPGDIRLSPLTYAYHTANEQIMVSYFISHTDQHYVKITRQSGEQYILPQISAWSRGAHYKEADIQWESSGDRAILTKGSEQHHFMRQSP